MVIDEKVVIGLISAFIGFLPQLYRIIKGQLIRKEQYSVGVLQQITTESQAIRRELRDEIISLKIDSDALQKENEHLQKENDNLNRIVAELQFKVKYYELTYAPPDYEDQNNVTPK